MSGAIKACLRGAERLPVDGRHRRPGLAQGQALDEARQLGREPAVPGVGPRRPDQSRQSASAVPGEAPLLGLHGHAGITGRPGQRHPVLEVTPQGANRALQRTLRHCRIQAGLSTLTRNTLSPASQSAGSHPRRCRANRMTSRNDNSRPTDSGYWSYLGCTPPRASSAEPPAPPRSRKSRQAQPAPARARRSRDHRGLAYQRTPGNEVNWCSILRKETRKLHGSSNRKDSRLRLDSRLRTGI